MLNNSHIKILTIDIGGSNVKATVLDYNGVPVSDYSRMETPQPATPEKVMERIQEVVSKFSEYDRISVGFPGYVKKGIVKTAPNLGTEYWVDYDLQSSVSTMLNKPTKVVNDADLQGAGVVSGNGLEMMITLGTGCGTALLLDG